MVDTGIISDLIKSTISSRQSELIQSDLDGTDSDISPVFESITMTPAAATIAVAGTTQLAVVAQTPEGIQIDVTKECTYSTGNAARATVSSGGLVTGVATGAAATITARYADLSDTSAITVS